LLFWDYYGIIADNMNMEGLTIAEMSELLGIPYETAKVRLFRAGIKPITKDALYDRSALEAIRNVPGKGRPKKPPITDK
jgi:hypothetical protein